MKEIEDVTGGCLKFRPKTDVDEAWIRINGEKGVGCSAEMGFQQAGRQELNLAANNCVRDAFKDNCIILRSHNSGSMYNSLNPFSVELQKWKVLWGGAFSAPPLK